mmetsp:Transcript_4976/g.14682  ORF Transcript_4976/g.14682 Transcript_4976/m.14682 type:complete len:207 (-) Transcript_4976:433-1053(-)
MRSPLMRRSALRVVTPSMVTVLRKVAASPISSTPVTSMPPSQLKSPATEKSPVKDTSPSMITASSSCSSRRAAPSAAASSSSSGLSWRLSRSWRREGSCTNLPVSASTTKSARLRTPRRARIAASSSTSAAAAASSPPAPAAPSSSSSPRRRRRWLTMVKVPVTRMLRNCELPPTDMPSVTPMAPVWLKSPVVTRSRASTTRRLAS